LHEFDDNVAVVATNVAIMSSGIVQFGQRNPRGGRWFNLGFGLRAGGVSEAPAVAVGVAQAQADVIQRRVLRENATDRWISPAHAV